MAGSLYGAQNDIMDLGGCSDFWILRLGQCMRMDWCRVEIGMEQSLQSLWSKVEGV